MLKMIIADDERIIRETISTIIDWKQYGITLTGLCSNGIEAYDMILDESPDLVITDIRMPGMNGLELISRVSQTDLTTQFILLSGYGEFEYAKQAMKYGVRHYLLKPCNEQQIIDAVQESIRDCYEKQRVTRLQDDQFVQADSMRNNVISSLINDALYLNMPLGEMIPTYEPYMDFHFTPYRLFYVFYLEQENLDSFLELLMEYWQENLPQLSVYGLYVKNTYLLFCQDLAFDYKKLSDWFAGISMSGQKTGLEPRMETFPDLAGLLLVVLEKIRRYSIFYYVNHFHPLCTCNYAAITQEVETLCREILATVPEAGPFGGELLERLDELLFNVMDISFLKQLSSSMFLKLTLNHPGLSSAGLTQWLIQTEEETDLETLKKSVAGRLREMLSAPSGCFQDDNFSDMTRQIFQYVRENLENPNLTLKYIAEQQLFMNVDYVSKKFQKETGIRFSNYLADERIQKAKNYIETSGADRIFDIAERVGFGNNPQYFSQLFKKKTGITPSAYHAAVHR